MTRLDSVPDRGQGFPRQREEPAGEGRRDGSLVPRSDRHAPGKSQAFDQAPLLRGFDLCQHLPLLLLEETDPFRRLRLGGLDRLFPRGEDRELAEIENAVRSSDGNSKRDRPISRLREDKPWSVDARLGWRRLDVLYGRIVSEAQAEHDGPFAARLQGHEIRDVRDQHCWLALNDESVLEKDLELIAPDRQLGSLLRRINSFMRRGKVVSQLLAAGEE